MEAWASSEIRAERQTNSGKRQKALPSFPCERGVRHRPESRCPAVSKSSDLEVQGSSLSIVISARTVQFRPRSRRGSRRRTGHRRKPALRLGLKLRSHRRPRHPRHRRKRRRPSPHAVPKLQRFAWRSRLAPPAESTVSATQRCHGAQHSTAPPRTRSAASTRRCAAARTQQRHRQKREPLPVPNHPSNARFLARRAADTPLAETDTR
jgi:hypothetical protein